MSTGKRRMSVSARADDCICQHGKCSHHEGKYACLAMLCACDGFRTEADPSAKPPHPANHPYFCLCYACKQHASKESDHG